MAMTFLPQQVEEVVADSSKVYDNQQDDVNHLIAVESCNQALEADNNRLQSLLMKLLLNSSSYRIVR